ncbi:MAG: 50S ribosomal protein L4 [Candidatus Liptonbacteria bacterium]|nr:50S ribosomal protein L4 [Candidatus Liptonbacteria bacterium]
MDNQKKQPKSKNKKSSQGVAVSKSPVGVGVNMETKVYNLKNEEVGKVELPKSVFGAAWKPALIKQIVLAQMANLRHPWAHAKGRGEVRGGGKKPWKQKGTGRSRHGSIRSPIWKGGGKSHGPTKERDYTQKVNKKMKRTALFSVLSRKFKDGEIKVVKDFNLEAPKTKLMSAALTGLTEKAKNTKKFDALLIYTSETKNISRSSRNLPKTKTLDAKGLNVYDILNYKHIILEEKAVEIISAHYKI